MCPSPASRCSAYARRARRSRRARSAGDRDSDAALFETALASRIDGSAELVPRPVHGGATRQASVRAGLRALEAQSPGVRADPRRRPLPPRRRSAGPRRRSRAPAWRRIPGLAGHRHHQAGGRERRRARDARPRALRAVQTPQAFRFATIHAAPRARRRRGVDDMPDDAAVIEWTGGRVHVFEGDAQNMKVTRPEDFALAEARAARRLAGDPDRTGL